MFAKITVVACLIGLARSGALHNAAANLGNPGYNGLAGSIGYGTHGLASPLGLAGNLGYGAHGLAGNLGVNGPAGNLGYRANPALGGATSYVNVVKEISNRGAYGNGAYPGVNGYNGLAGYGAVGHNVAAGYPNTGYAGAAVPYAGGLGTYGSAGYPFNRNLGYPSAGYGAAFAGSAYLHVAGNALAGAAGHGGVPTSYSNIYNGPLRSPLLGNGAYGAGAAGYGGYGYGNGYGNGQAW